MREPPVAAQTCDVPASRPGRVSAIDNRRIARLAKLAGAPDAKAAGVVLHVKLGDRVEAQAPLMTVHAESTGELAYAMRYSDAYPDIVCIEENG
jgi:thymidine phosphorylase